MLRVTPIVAWEATTKAEAPRPTRERFIRPVLTRPAPAPVPTDLSDDTIVKTLTTYGTFMLDKVHYKVDGRRGLEKVLIITHDDKITVADLHGEILIEHTRPAPGVTYVGNGQPRGRRPKTAETSPMS